MWSIGPTWMTPALLMSTSMPPKRSTGALELRLVACDERQARALPGELARHDQPESARSARDEDRLAREVVRVAAPPHLRGEHDAGADGRPDRKRPFLLVCDSHEDRARNAGARVRVGYDPTHIRRPYVSRVVPDSDSA